MYSRLECVCVYVCSIEKSTFAILNIKNMCDFAIAREGERKCHWFFPLLFPRVFQLQRRQFLCSSWLSTTPTLVTQCESFHLAQSLFYPPTPAPINQPGKAESKVNHTVKSKEKQRKEREKSVQHSIP